MECFDGEVEKNANVEEGFTSFECQVLTDLLVVARMSEVKDAVSC